MFSVVNQIASKIGVVSRGAGEEAVSDGATVNINISSREEGTVEILNKSHTGTILTETEIFFKPHAIYNGGFEQAKDIKLRIANGGAGQSGLIRAWADAFIQHCVSKGSDPFLVGWYLGDTTESLALLAAGSVDVAVTYNLAAEQHSIEAGAASKSVYGFRDHFILVGPKSNPAQLDKNDDILTMFNKIVTQGNRDIIDPPEDRPPTRFLTRFDKSATNIKESQIFITIGQVPWALVYSRWYHQYPRFPMEALEAASLLHEYTLTDRGTWLSSPINITGTLDVYKAGSDSPSDLLLNPAHVLLGTQASVKYAKISSQFIKWVTSSDGGQKIIEGFEKNGQLLYSKAP